MGPVVKKEFHVDHHGQKSSSCLKLAGRCEWDASNAKVLSRAWLIAIWHGRDAHLARVPRLACTSHAQACHM